MKLFSHLASKSGAATNPGKMFNREIQDEQGIGKIRCVSN